MEIQVIRTTYPGIRDFRALFLQENRFQFIHNKCYENGWADVWMFLANGGKAGYGSIWVRTKERTGTRYLNFT